MNLLENRTMPGFVNLPMYEILLDAVSALPGRYIEFGINKAVTFGRIYRRGRRDSHGVVAVDSFKGMPAPIMPGDEKFPEGTFDTGGSKWFKDKFPQAIVYEGFIPEILEILELDQAWMYAFAHVDLDHQLSTLQTLEWVWPKMSHGGILVCHDYNETDQTCAPKAIRDWKTANGLHHIGYCDHSIWFRKGDS